jgi:NAD(P)-dependent dehydrogenase (short-subunit alcohol dehydrogenase family)
MGAAKVALVTGSTDGVGRVVAQQLGAAGYRVLVHGRDRARGQAVVRALPDAELFIADLSRLSEVRQLAQAVPQGIDLLVNNAGIRFVGGAREVSPEGFELHFAVNYLAGYVLTRLLAPKRVVNVSSISQEQLDLDDLMMTRGYSGERGYSQSKLAQVMMTLELAQELPGTIHNALHPSTFMDTPMVRRAGITPQSSVKTGAEAILKLCTDETRSGLFFDVKKESRAHAQAYDAPARKKLLELSKKLTRV